jgi:hypothetical protein
MIASIIGFLEVAVKEDSKNSRQLAGDRVTRGQQAAGSQQLAEGRTSGMRNGECGMRNDRTEMKGGRQ